MTASEVDTRELKIFQTLQRSYLQLWADTHIEIYESPYEFSERLEQDQKYYRLVSQFEHGVMMQFEIDRQNLRSIVLKGIMNDWSWEEE